MIMMIPSGHVMVRLQGSGANSSVCVVVMMMVAACCVIMIPMLLAGRIVPIVVVIVISDWQVKAPSTYPLGRRGMPFIFLYSRLSSILITRAALETHGRLVVIVIGCDSVHIDTFKIIISIK
jgi:hypothetical protein